MGMFVCEKCGSSSFFEKDGFTVCAYCRTRYESKKEAVSSISLMEDIRLLLQKCRENPKKASRYASLVLDLDPTNEEAMEYL